MRARKILLADDSSDFCSLVTETLSGRFELRQVDSVETFRETFRPYAFDLILLDMRLDTEREGLELLRKVMGQDALQPVIMVSAYGDSEAILDATEAGALMFLHKKEFTPELLGRMVDAVLEQARMRRQVSALESRVQVEDPLSLSAGNPLVKQAQRAIERATIDSAPVVLLMGATGAGLDLAAQGIHARSSRRSPAPLVIYNAAALSVREQRTRFFGLEGSTDMSRRKGLLEEAQWGVLFIDHFAVLDAGVQTSILDSVEVQRLGSNRNSPLDLQLILGGTPADLPALRESLTQVKIPASRVVEIHLPSLRQRSEDLPLLAAYFLQQLRGRGRTSAQSIVPTALHALCEHDWPGNLHELSACIEIAAVRAALDGSETLELPHLPVSLRSSAVPNVNIVDGFSIHRHLAQVEAQAVETAIRQHPDLNKTELAALLGYNDRYALSRRMRRILAEYPDTGKETPKMAGWYS